MLSHPPISKRYALGRSGYADRVAGNHAQSRRPISSVFERRCRVGMYLRLPDTAVVFRLDERGFLAAHDTGQAAGVPERLETDGFRPSIARTRSACDSLKAGANGDPW